MFKNVKHTMIMPESEIAHYGIKVFDSEGEEYLLDWKINIIDGSELFALVNCKTEDVMFQCNYEGLNCLRKMVDAVDAKKIEIEKFRLESNRE